MLQRRAGSLLAGAGVAVLAVLGGTVPRAGAAGTIHQVVPGQSIQAAIDAAGAGDTIDIAAGEYHENIHFGTQALTVHGAGAGSTTIIGQTAGYVASVYGNRDSVLEGVTLTGGHYDSNQYVDTGGLALNGSPTIRNNTITKNVICYQGAVATRGGAPLIQGNVISDNYTQGCATFGGGIGSGGGAPEIVGNTITGNSVASSGGGIDLNGGAGIVRDNVISDNSAASGGGISVVNETPTLIVDNLITGNHGYTVYGPSAGVDLEGGHVRFVNNTLAGNVGAALQVGRNDMTIANNIIDSDLQAIVCDTSYMTVPLVLDHNLVHSGSGESYSFACGPTVSGAGNTRDAPHFRDPGHGDYRLGVGSPAVDGGSSAISDLPAMDLDGHPRVTDDDGDGVPVVDMGAYEGARGGGFHAVPPFRLLDSRTATGGWGATKLIAGTPRPLAVVGTPGIPMATSAVVLSVTVTNGSLPSFLTVFPPGTTPVASNLNFAANETTSNLVVARVGAAGQVMVANAVGAVDVVIDVLGTFDDGSVAADTGGLYTGTTPTRLLDSRGATGGWPGALGPGETRPLTVVGASVPAAATAVIVNVTVTSGTMPSFLRLAPFGAPPGSTSNVLFAPGQTISGLVSVGVGDAGRVAFTNQQGSVHVVADVVGYFAPAGATPLPGSRFHPTTPGRILDDRVGVGLSGPWGPNQTRTLAVTGSRIPSGATGVVMNTTATNASTGSFVTVSPSPTPAPATSSLLFGPHDTRANLTVTGLPPSGAVDIYNQLGFVDVVGDTTGYFGPS